MTTNEAQPIRLGDVVLDSYANPAVIVRIEMRGTPHERWSIMQTCGSDRGNVTSCPVNRATGRPYDMPAATEEHIEAIRAIVRTEAARQGWKWNTEGITR